MLNGLSIRYLLLIAIFSFLFFWLNLSLAVSASNNDLQYPTLTQFSLLPPKTTDKITDFFSGMHHVVAISSGAYNTQILQDQSLVSIDHHSYHYKSEKSHSKENFWGVFIGSEFSLSPTWALIGGIGYYQPKSFSSKGTMNEIEGAVNLNTFQYSYKINSKQLLAEGKLLWLVKERIHPYFMLGLGAAFNKMYNYNTTPPLTNLSKDHFLKRSFLLFSSRFSSDHNNASFSYALGPGIDLTISKSIRFGVGYRFTDLGHASTARDPINLLSNHNSLQQPHLFANQFIAQITFIPFNR